MKKVILLLLAFTFACDEEPEVVREPDVTIDVRAKLSEGRWRINSFVNDGIDETSSFADYIFEFESSGVLTGEDGFYTHFGTWSAVRDTDAENTIDNVEVHFAFSNPPGFQVFNRSWKITDFAESNVTFVSEAHELEFRKQ